MLSTCEIMKKFWSRFHHLTLRIYTMKWMMIWLFSPEKWCTCMTLHFISRKKWMLSSRWLRNIVLWARRRYDTYIVFIKKNIHDHILYLIDFNDQCYTAPKSYPKILITPFIKARNSLVDAIWKYTIEFLQYVSLEKICKSSTLNSQKYTVSYDTYNSSIYIHAGKHQ